MTLGERDHEHRLALATATEDNVFVSAGAGSGKTTALVDRVTSLVVGVPSRAEGASGERLLPVHWHQVADAPVLGLDQVAVVTFTEKAASELVHRLRERFAAIAQGAPDPASPPAQRARAALAVIDQAPVGTIHAFGRRLLQTRPVEAGLPPRIQVLDQFTSAALAASTWAEVWREVLHQADDDQWLAWSLGHLIGSRKVKVGSLADLFRHVERARPARPVAPVRSGEWVRDQLESFCERSQQTSRLPLAPGTPASSGSEARHPALRNDTLSRWLGELGPTADFVSSALAGATDDRSLLEVLDDLPTRLEPCPASQARASWAKAGHDLTEVLARAQRCDPHRVVGGIALALVLAPLTRAAHDTGRARAHGGRLTYDDLVALPVELLRADPEARQALRARYAVVLLDEFQDTDPLQVELVVRLLADDHRPAQDWHQHRLPPGRLVTVGDPKQSIYGFRSADIATFLAAERWLAGRGASRLTLSRNFRSHPEVVQFLNALFSQVFLAEDRTQPGYEPLVPARPGADLGGPVVHLLGAPPGHDPGLDPGPGTGAPDRRTAADPETSVAGSTASAGDVRRAEAADVAAVVADALGLDTDGLQGGRSPWLVLAEPDTDGAGRASGSSSGTPPSPAAPRPAQPRDVAVLIPARNFLPALEEALASAGIPYQVEGSGLMYETWEVRGLLQVLRAVDAPGDPLAVVHALRSTVMGCSDDELARHRLADGTFRATEHERGGHPRVRAGLTQLARWSEARHVIDTGQLIDRICTDLMVYEQAAPALDRRDRWRRLRAFAHQARSWCEREGGSLREYLAWVDQRRQAAERLGGEFREAEAVLADTDVAAVRIMTIHAAKGLEFPVVVVAGLSAGRPAGGRAEPVQLGDGPAGIEVRLRDDLATPGWRQDREARRRYQDAELIRLLYVAATRAESHLVLSLHHRTGASRSAPLRQGWEAVLATDRTWADRVQRCPPAPLRASATPPEPPALDDAAARRWTRMHHSRTAARAAWLARAARQRTWSATAIASALAGTTPAAPDELTGQPGDPGLEKQARDLDQPASRKGRYGTQIGRAVHAVIQTIPLADAPVEAVAARSAWYAEAEGIGDLAGEVADRVTSVLACPLLTEAAAADASGRAWRETYVGTTVGTGDDQAAIEGYIDLVYATGQGLVVVDVKTDRVEGDGRHLQERYGPQLATYALALERTTGQPVVSTWLVVARPGQAALALEVDHHRHRPAVLATLAPRGTADPGGATDPD